LAALKSPLAPYPRPDAANEGPPSPHNPALSGFCMCLETTWITPSHKKVITGERGACPCPGRRITDANQ